MENAKDLRVRTKQLALRVIRLVVGLPTTDVGSVIGKQLLRCGTSVGANYREGCRARSPAEFISILQIALREAEETSYWLELLAEAEVAPVNRLTPLQTEVGEITAMLVASINTAKKNRN